MVMIMIDGQSPNNKLSCADTDSNQLKSEIQLGVTLSLHQADQLLRMVSMMHTPAYTDL